MFGSDVANSIFSNKIICLMFICFFRLLFMVAIIVRQRFRFWLIKLFDVDDLYSQRLRRSLMLFDFKLHDNFICDIFTYSEHNKFFNAKCDICETKTKYALRSAHDLICFYSIHPRLRIIITSGTQFLHWLLLFVYFHFTMLNMRQNSA